MRTALPFLMTLLGGCPSGAPQNPEERFADDMFAAQTEGLPDAASGTFITPDEEKSLKDAAPDAAKHAQIDAFRAELADDVLSEAERLRLKELGVTDAQLSRHEWNYAWTRTNFARFATWVDCPEAEERVAILNRIATLDLAAMPYEERYRMAEALEETVIRKHAQDASSAAAGLKVYARLDVDRPLGALLDELWDAASSDLDDAVTDYVKTNWDGEGRDFALHRIGQGENWTRTLAEKISVEEAETFNARFLATKTMRTDFFTALAATGRADFMAAYLRAEPDDKDAWEAFEPALVASGETGRDFFIATAKNPQAAKRARAFQILSEMKPVPGAAELLESAFVFIRDPAADANLRNGAWNYALAVDPEKLSALAPSLLDDPHFRGQAQILTLQRDDDALKVLMQGPDEMPRRSVIALLVEKRPDFVKSCLADKKERYPDRKLMDKLLSEKESKEREAANLPPAATLPPVEVASPAQTAAKPQVQDVAFAPLGVTEILPSGGAGWAAIPLVAGVNPMGEGNKNAMSFLVDAAGKFHIVYLNGTDLLYAAGSAKNTNDAAPRPLRTYVLEHDVVSLGANAMQISPSGEIHLAYTGKDGDLRYATNASGVWQAATLDAQGDTGYRAALALDAKGKIHIAYHDQTNDDLRYATNVSGKWTSRLVDGEGKAGYRPDIAVDAKGRAHIAYPQGPDNDVGLRYVLIDGDGQRLWTVDAEGSTGLRPSLALDAKGNPHISYYDNTRDDLRYATIQGGSHAEGEWRSLAVDTRELESPSSLTVDPNGRVLIAYTGVDGDKRELRYAALENGIWGMAVADDESSMTGKVPVIAFGGAVYIAYYDYEKQEIRVATQKKK